MVVKLLAGPSCIIELQNFIFPDRISTFYKTNADVNSYGCAAPVHSCYQPAGHFIHTFLEGAMKFAIFQAKLDFEKEEISGSDFDFSQQESGCEIYNDAVCVAPVHSVALEFDEIKASPCGLN